MADHPNSRKITIFRAGSFLSRAQGADAAPHFADAKVSVGSYFESVSASKIASGLSFSEEELLLPNIIDTPKEDREFRKKIKEFYLDINTYIPAQTGAPLEVGLEKDNALPVSTDNMPLKLSDYLKWRHHKGHPYMAANKKEAEGNALKQYYIFDPEGVEIENKDRNQKRDVALQLYLGIKNEKNKVDMMLTLLNIDPREFTGKNVDEKKQDALREKADKEPTIFSDIYQSADLEIRYWIQAMVNTGVLSIHGGKYYNTETQKLLGNHLEETIFYFKDDENSDQVIVLKGLLQEALKKAPDKKRVTTKALAGKVLAGRR